MAYEVKAINGAVTIDNTNPATVVLYTVPAGRVAKVILNILRTSYQSVMLFAGDINWVSRNIGISHAPYVGSPANSHNTESGLTILTDRSASNPTAVTKCVVLNAGQTVELRKPSGEEPGTVEYNFQIVEEF